MNNHKKKFYFLIFAGIFSVTFLMLITTSFYNYVLKKIGIDNAENERKYDYHFVMLVSDKDSEFWQDVYKSIRAEGEKNSAYIELKGKEKSSSYTMIDFMDMAIASNVDGIFLDFNGEKGLTNKVNEATSAKIPVVTLLNDAPTTTRKSYIGINSYQLGKKYALEIMNLLPRKLDADDDSSDSIVGNTKIDVMLHNNSVDSNQAQIFNQINNLMVTSDKTQGKVRVVEKRFHSENTFDSEKRVWEMFQDEKELPDIVVCMDEVDTEAVYQAVIDHNRVGQTKILGYYKSSSTLNAIKYGTISMSLFIDTEEMGKYGVQAMMESVLDGRTNSFYSVGLKFITIDNVDDFLHERGRDETKQIKR